jgi:predicted glycosyltransferase
MDSRLRGNDKGGSLFSELPEKYLAHHHSREEPVLTQVGVEIRYTYIVIPAYAGMTVVGLIPTSARTLDSRLRGNDKGGSLFSELPEKYLAHRHSREEPVLTQVGVEIRYTYIVIPAKAGIQNALPGVNRNSF